MDGKVGMCSIFREMGGKVIEIGAKLERWVAQSEECVAREGNGCCVISRLKDDD
jgi:hypothetical protein